MKIGKDNGAIIKSIKRDLQIRKFVREINSLVMLKSGNPIFHKGVCESTLKNGVHPEELKKHGASPFIDETIQYWKDNDYEKKFEAAEEENKKAKEKAAIQSRAVKRQKGLF